MAFTLCNKYAKNLCKRILLVQRIIRKCGHMFFGTQYSIMFVKKYLGLGGGARAPVPLWIRPWYYVCQGMYKSHI